jgi:tellurite resistance protein
MRHQPFSGYFGPAGTPAGLPAAPVEPVSIRIPQSGASKGTPIPSSRTALPALPNPSTDAKYWIPAGQDISFYGYALKGGLFYMGRGLMAVSGSDAEPALIDPSLLIAQGTNCHTRGTDYWPTYHAISPTARAAYLQWLSTGKSDPEADIGYVFLYFYGLERRALSCFDPPLNREVNQIEDEIRRLLSIYGGNSSFTQYAHSLLDFLAAKRYSGKNPQTLPDLPQPRRHWELPFEMRVALGIFAKEGRPVPPEWAVRWYECLSNQASAYRLCREQFVELFKHMYTELHGEGILLTRRANKLTVLHQTASPTFGFGNMVSAELDLPDVSAGIRADDAIRWIGSECNSCLSPYGRFINSHPDKAKSIEAACLLPFSVWPEDSRHHVLELKVAMESDGGCKVTALQDLLPSLEDWSSVSKKAYARLSTELDSVGMGIEPDVRVGGRVPAPDQPIALFLADRSSSNATVSGGYATAEVLVHLAGVIAAASRDFDEAETNVILDHVNTAFQLTRAESARLAARLRIYRVLPPTATGLKRKIEGLQQATRETICDLLIQVSLAHGTVDPEAVRVLETLFTLLGVDKSMLYSRLHKVQTGSPDTGIPIADAPEATDTRKGVGQIRFDMDKVASLRAESEKIAAVLDEVFGEPVVSGEPETPAADEHEETMEASLLGLDAEHASLLRVLLQRPQWGRSEIEQICQDRNLMVNGAIEQINEASFDCFDCAVLEGDDPIDVNYELLAKEIA